MFGQNFQFSDIGTIGFLIILEALLSADNALVLAIMVRHLPRELQRKALMYGLGGAFVLRSTAILLAAYIISFWWLQAIGALYLLFLPVKHFMEHGKDDGVARVKNMGFWPTVARLELVDVAFAVDSVLAAVAVVDTVKHPDKLWVVIAGAVIGIVVLRVAAGFFIRILEKYPVLDHVAYLMVGWAGVKLFSISGHSFVRWYNDRNPSGLFPFDIPHMPSVVFWGGMFTIAIGGTLLAIRAAKQNPVPDSESEAHIVEEVFEGDSKDA